MKTRWSAPLVIVAALAVCASAGVAHADAVPPPPRSCPPGQVGITSHGGPECVKKAPESCPPGYRGVIRGRCVLATCSSDGQCKQGRRCLQIATCQEHRELHWTGWGWSAKRPTPMRHNFLAGPPAPRPPGPPKKDWVKLHICGQDGPCNAPATCRAAGLCYPPGAIGKTKAKVVTDADAQAQGTDPSAATTPTGGAPLSTPAATNDVARGNGDASAPTPGSQEPMTDGGGGCRKGCSATANGSAMGWVVLPLLAGLGLLRRRRRYGLPQG